METKRETGASEAQEIAALFPEETAHLREIEAQVVLELQDAQDRVDRMEEEQRELQQ